MRFLFFFYFIVANIWCDHYYAAQKNSSNKSSYRKTSHQSSEQMSLDIEEIDISMQDFLRSQHEANEDIDPHWYRLDENNEELKERNFQNNILRILLEQLVENFHNLEEERIDVIKSILEFMNDFIKERYIPRDYHEVIRKIFSYTEELQNKPVPNIAPFIFSELSQDAQKAFRDNGVRVQTNGFSSTPRGKSKKTMHADPMLVEILLLQLIADAQKRSGTRQKFLDSIEENMNEIENLFEDDSSDTLAENFEHMRSTLVDEIKKENPLPALARYIISLLRNVKDDKQVLENEYKELLEDNAADEWKEITKVKAKAAISIWKENKEEAKEKKKKTAKTALIKKIKDETITGIKNKGMTKDAFKEVMSNVMSSVDALGGETTENSDAGGILGNLLGG